MQSSPAQFSTAPGTLISVPQLQDPHFARSVVAMLVHNAEGAIGLVINHPVPLRCGEVAAQFELPWPGDPMTPLLRGGPVDPEGLWMLHDDTFCFDDSLAVTDFLVTSRSRHALETLCRTSVEDLGGDRLRLGVGCAGWGPGQLEQELAEGSWVTGELSPELVYEWPREEVWERALRQLGIDPARLVTGGGVQ